MKPGELPAFEECFPELSRFILELVQAYEAGRLRAWDDLEREVKAYFTPARMDRIESLAPGWKKMASYSDGITLVHVMCVFLGMFMLPEFQRLTNEQQQMARWIVLFHDIAKAHRRGTRDTMHAFNSAVQAARALPALGFPTTQHYREVIQIWADSTQRASIAPDGNAAPGPDNRKLAEILTGIEQLYGREAPAALILTTILLHISLPVDPLYPTPAPLTEDEIRHYIRPAVFPLLRVMMLSDNEGWSLFDPQTRAQQRRDTLAAFEKVQQLIS